METTKYTKNQLVEAFETFKESNRVIKDICQSVEPVVENAVIACVEKAKDIADIYNAEDFTVSEADGIITVHVGDKQLARIEPTPETE